MTVSFKATMLGGSATDQQFVATAFDEAAKWYTPLLDGTATLDFTLRLRPLAGNVIASTGGMEGVRSGDSGPYEPGTVTEIRTGVDPNGAAPDAYIDVDVAKLA